MPDYTDIAAVSEFVAACVLGGLLTGMVAVFVSLFYGSAGRA